MAVKGFEFVLGRNVDPKALGAQLRKLRASCLTSAAELAEFMDWNSQNVLRLERGGGGREPTLTSVNRYVRMLGFELALVVRPRAKSAPRAAKGEGPEEPEIPEAGDDEKG
jgi:hypothetical protein